MKRFLLYIILFLAFLLFILQIPGLLLPEYWGNDRFRAKFSYLDKTTHNYSTYFIGSSRVGNGIIPEVFDRLNNKKNQSFNISVPGSSSLENLRVLKILINNSDFNAKEIFIECPTFTVPEGRNRNSVRGIYYYDSYAFFIQLKNIYSKKTNVINKINSGFEYTILYLKYLLKINLLQTQIKQLIGFSPAQNIPSIKTNHGYAPLKIGSQNPKLIKRRNQFLKNTSILNIRRKGAKEAFQKEYSYDEIVNHHVDELKQLIKTAKNKNIDLYFMLLPKAPASYYEDVYKHLLVLPESNYVNVANPIKYPNLYQLEYSFDRAHLTFEGSKILTKALYNEYTIKKELKR